MSCVLDPCALALLRHPESHERCKAIDHVLENLWPCYMTTTNVAEAYRLVYRHDRTLAENLLDIADQDGLIKIIDVDRELIRLAVEAKSNYGVSYASAFPAAYARINDYPLVAARLEVDDGELIVPEMEIIESHRFCAVQWI